MRRREYFTNYWQKKFHFGCTFSSHLHTLHTVPAKNWQKSFKTYAKCNCIKICKLTELNLGLVTSVAMRFRGRGAENEDLIQIGSIGLLKAIRSFDPGRGFFLDYCLSVKA